MILFLYAGGFERGCGATFGGIIGILHLHRAGTSAPQPIGPSHPRPQSTQTLNLFCLFVHDSLSHLRTPCCCKLSTLVTHTLTYSLTLIYSHTHSILCPPPPPPPYRRLLYEPWATSSLVTTPRPSSSSTSTLYRHCSGCLTTPRKTSAKRPVGHSPTSLPVINAKILQLTLILNLRKLVSTHFQFTSLLEL